MGFAALYPSYESRHFLTVFASAAKQSSLSPSREMDCFATLGRTLWERRSPHRDGNRLNAASIASNWATTCGITR